MSDEYPIIKKGLKALTFSDEAVGELYDTITDVISIASSVVSVVGAFNSITALAKSLGLLPDHEEEQRRLLAKMAEQIEAIYEYHKQEEKEQQYHEAVAWRVDLAGAFSWRREVTTTSRAFHILNNLNIRLDELDDSLNRMFLFGKIAFSRDAYDQTPRPQQILFGSWLDAAISPFMTRADGSPIKYALPSEDLQGRVWDPGYYIDVLVRSIEERIAGQVALEPAFRSSGFRRAHFATIASGLDTFIQKYRDNLWVAVPSAGIEPSVLSQRGYLRNPYFAEVPNYYRGNPAPDGIVLGAFDPVTGNSNISTWSDFEITYQGVWPFNNVKNPYEPTWVADRSKALSAATAEQGRRLTALTAGTMIGKLTELRDALVNLSRPPFGSEFVTFDHFRLTLLGGLRTKIPTTEEVDLGRYKEYSPNPNRTYTATRWRQQVEVRIPFRIAKRAEYSRIQLGYRVQIGSKSYDICRWEHGGPGPDAIFTPVKETITVAARKYDCLQRFSFNEDQEESYAKTGIVPDNHERVLQNLRQGDATLDVEINYLTDGGSMVHWREVELILRTPVDVEDTDLDAYELGVQVFETHLGIVDDEEVPEEVTAASITATIVPSYLIVDQAYFDDLYHAMLTAAKAQVAAKLEVQKSWRDIRQQIPTEPFPDPQYGVLRPAILAERSLDFLDAAWATKHRDVTNSIRRYQAARELEL